MIGRNLPTHNTRGASYIELLVITILILIFIVMVINRVWPLRIAAERVSMEHMLGTLNSALGIEMVARASHGGLAHMADLEGSNPMNLLDEPPANYIGELQTPEPENIDGYSWYFDRTRKILVYRVANDDYFETELPGPARARFQLRLHYRDSNNNQRYDPGIDTLAALRLEALESYHWKIEADGTERTEKESRHE